MTFLNTIISHNNGFLLLPLDISPLPTAVHFSLASTLFCIIVILARHKGGVFLDQLSIISHSKALIHGIGDYL
jgi:hypothetical protein